MDNKSTILVVDDSPVVLSLLSDVLTTAGYEVSSAGNGEQALASTAAINPDIILLDILMPGMDGFEVCSRLKSQKETCHIPVIFLTTDDSLKDKVKGLSLGAVDYVCKPFQTKDLLARVGIHLEISRMNEELRQKTNALKKSRELLAETERIGKVGGWELDIATGRQTWTEGVYIIHEVDTSFVPTLENVVNFYTSESRPVIEHAVQRAIEDGETFDLELEIITAKGNLRWVHAVGNASSEPGGSRKVFGIFQDITERKRAEVKLATSQKIFKDFSDYNPSLIYALDSEGRYLLSNRRLETLFGLQRGQFIGRTRDEFMLPEVAAEHRANDLRVIEKRQAVAFEEFNEEPDGKHTYLSIKFPLLDLGGKIYGVGGISTDITERKRAEEALRKNEELYRSLFENMLNGFAYCRMLFEEGKPKDFIYLAVNSRFELLTGLKDVVGRRVSEVIPGILESDPQLIEIYGCVAMTGQSVRFERFVESLQDWYSISVYGTAHEHFVAVFDVVTERKRSEEKLAQSEAEFRRLSMEFHGLLDAIPDSLMLLDRDMKVHWVNRAAIETIGLTSENIADQCCYALWEKGSAPCDLCPAIQSFSTGKPWNETVRRPDGSIWDIRTVPLSDAQGEIVNVIELSRDITEHRKLEDQLRHSQKMESIGTLAGGIAHDFNNILTAIIGYGKLALMKMPVDNPLRQNVENMLEGADRAAHLTRELLQFSRKQAIERKPVDLNMVVVKLEKFLKKIIGEDIAFKTVLHETPLPVLADEHHLEQVLMNLATNARDAMPQGGALTVTTGIVTLSREFIAAHGYGKLGTYAHIIFADTGMGMDEATQQRIFEPFFTTKEVGKGTGLGLAVSYGIIKQHDGYIIVYSEPGRGTVFRIYLPIILSEAVEVPRSEQETPAVGGAETILLAEDDEAVRNLTRRVLTEFGYTVIEAVDGSDTVSKFLESSAKVDLLLLDIIMPKMNGKEAFDEIRKIRPEIKAIFSSGYAPETIRQKASLAEDVNLITKPVSPTELLRMVRSVLDGVQE
jgi:PAS domain S-box-containing protein